MRYRLPFIVVLILGHGVSAAEPPTAEREDAARDYAQLLIRVVDEIRSGYVREVDEAALYEAALAGLYEHQRERLPVWVGPALKKAVAEQNSDWFRIITEVYLALPRADQVRPAKLYEASLQAMPRALDPYCGLTSSSDFRIVQQDYESGFGFDLAGVKRVGTPLVRQQLDTATTMAIPVDLPYPWRIGIVQPGSPAQRAGLRPNDLVTHVRGVEITPENSLELFELLRLPPELAQQRALTFTVRRPGRETPVQLDIPRNAYQTESVFGVRRRQDHQWDHSLGSETMIGYARIGAIDRLTPQQLTDALMRLEDEGMVGLVLDLRWCPGGYLQPATQIAELFLAKGLIATTQYRNPVNQGQREYRAGVSGLPSFRAKNYPVVILINGETSGGGELIAAALRDNDRARIAGQRSRGKASVQSSVSIPLPGMSFKLTTGTFQRPNGQDMQRFPNSTMTDKWGVQPDPGGSVPMTADLSQELKGWHEQMALRPGTSREALPLDDPTADAQREWAKRWLIRMVREREMGK